MWDRFNERAKRMMRCSRELALATGWDAIDAVHLLLGFLDVDTWCVRSMLGDDNASATLRAEIEAQVGRGRGSAERLLPFTPAAKRSLEAMMACAAELETPGLAPEHLFAAVIAHLPRDVQATLGKRGITSATVLGHLRAHRRSPHGPSPTS